MNSGLPVHPTAHPNTSLHYLILGVLMCGLLSHPALIGAQPPGQLLIGNFSPAVISNTLPDQWQLYPFKMIPRQTRYKLVQTADKTALLAQSDNAASALVRTLNVDPKKYPRLSWSWKPDSILKKGNLRQKSGDDSPARLYVLFDQQKAADRLRWSYRYQFPKEVICYVWANHLPRQRIIENPYAKRVKMVVVGSGIPKQKKWYSYQRNLVYDYTRIFGRAPDGIRIVGLALMTDTDNTGGRVQTYFGNILLSLP